MAQLTTMPVGYNRLLNYPYIPYTHLTLASQTNALDALADLDAAPAETLHASGTDDISAVPETVPEKRANDGSFGKELEGGNVPSHDHSELGKPLPVLEIPRTSGMMRASSEGGGIGRRAGLRIQNAKATTGQTETTCDTPPSGLTSNLALSDPNLAAVIDAWPMLPEPVRAGILAMVKAITGKG